MGFYQKGLGSKPTIRELLGPGLASTADNIADIGKGHDHFYRRGMTGKRGVGILGLVEDVSIAVPTILAVYSIYGSR